MRAKNKSHVNIIIRWTALAGFMLCGISHAASFDCTKANTDIEITICSDPELSEADSILASTYKRAVSNNPAAKERQTAWLRNVRSTCRDRNCLLQVYKQQTTALTINFIGPEAPLSTISSAPRREVYLDHTSTTKGDDSNHQSAVKYTASQPLPPQQVTSSKSSTAQVQEKANSGNQKRTQTVQEDKNEGPSNLFMIYLIVVAVAGYFIWNKFLRFRCPDCKSTKIDTINVHEIDRWRGNKKVTETNTRGSKTRYIYTTFVKMQYRYQCVECQSQWVALKKEEL